MIQLDPLTDKVQIIDHKTSIINFKSKALVIANGAAQSIHPNFETWFPNNSHKVISSDLFLKSQTFISEVEKLNQLAKGKVVIIGGSHSGFSCAWLLLNGPACLAQHGGKIPFANRKTIRQCPDCCFCGLHQRLTMNKSLVLKKQTNLLSPDSCNCVCKCFGYFKHDDWPEDLMSKLP